MCVCVCMEDEDEWNEPRNHSAKYNHLALVCIAHGRVTMDIIKQQASSVLTDFDKGTEKMYVLAIDLRSQLSSEYTYVKAMFRIGSFYARWANNPLMLVRNFTHSNVHSRDVQINGVP